MSSQPKNPFLQNRLASSHHRLVNKPHQVHVLFLQLDKNHFRLILPGERSNFPTQYFARRIQCVLLEYQKKLLYRLRPRPDLTFYFSLAHNHVEVVTPTHTYQIERDAQGNLTLLEHPAQSNK
jgi:hypothetical protein